MTPLLWGSIPTSHYFRSETRYCSMLIGALTAIWSLLGLVPHRESLFVTTLRTANLGNEWFFLMLLTGLLLIISSVFPLRSLRHIALFGASLVWTSMTGVFLLANLITPVTVSAPLFALWPILLMYADAKNKPRGAT